MLFFGVDYYPEHWPEERWPEDARLMAEAGLNVVRLVQDGTPMSSSTLCVEA